MRQPARLNLTLEQTLLLEGLIDQMNRSTGQACDAIDKALIFVEASNRRIAEMERNRMVDINDRFISKNGR
jgi:hypothetical protein